MNVLVIRNSGWIAGAELYYPKLADAFKKYRHDCMLILLTDNTVLATLATTHGIQSEIVDVFGKEIGTKKDLIRLAYHLPQYLWEYLRTIRAVHMQTPIDVVLFSGKTEKLILTPFVRLMGLPVIWLEHGRVFTATMSAVVLTMYKVLYRCANSIAVEAVDSKMDLLEHGIVREKITYIGSGVDTERYLPKKRSGTHTFTVGFMATVCWEKGIGEFLSIAREVCQHNDAIAFLVIGGGAQLEYAKAFVAKHNLRARVSLIGRKERPKKYLSRIDILLSPIHHPGGISLSVQEAMSCGVVPIVTDIGGNRELVQHGKTGYIYAKDFVYHASERILYLSRHATVLQRLSVNARIHIQMHFSAKLLVKRWNDFFVQLTQ